MEKILCVQIPTYKFSKIPYFLGQSPSTQEMIYFHGKITIRITLINRKKAHQNKLAD
jgi:hypothetical protein